MKRGLFIIGVIIILGLISVWLFLLFASDETKQDVYNRFGLTGTEESGIISDIVDAVLPDLEMEKPPLRQLTTKRVIGYTEVTLASSSPQIYFAEAGTGHIYTLDLQNSVETKISNVTAAGARQAHISKNATMAAIRTGEEEIGSLTVVLFTGDTTDSFTIDEPVLDFTITDDDQLLYTTPDATGVIGRSFDVESRVARTIFTVPFRQVEVAWGTQLGDAHYIQPKTSRLLESYLYKVVDGTLNRMPISGYGLNVLPAGPLTIFTKASDNRYALFVHDEAGDFSYEASTFFFPEKCTVSSTQIMYCGHDGRASTNALFPDNWYRGEVSHADNIWSFNIQAQEPTQLINATEVSGRELDIIDTSLSLDEFSLYFKNKNDHTLWVYDIVSTFNQ